MTKNKHKIAIVGTHSTGKTSIVELFRQNYNDGKVHVLNEVARDMINNGYKLGKGGTQEVYIKYVEEQLKRETLSEKVSYDLLISDRSLVDGIAYPIINERLGITPVSKDLLRLFESILYFQKSFYDAYFYVPICFKNVIDGVRDPEEDYRKEADIEIKRLLTEHIGSYYQLKCGTLREMYNEISETVRKLKND